MLTLDDSSRVEDEDDEEVEVEDEVELELELEVELVVGWTVLEGDGVGVGVGVGVGLGVGFGVVDTFGAGVSSGVSLLLSSPSMGNTTIRAVDPLGTVTTQKSAPPAPVAERELVTLPTSVPPIAQGRPTQGPSHSIRRPKSGGANLNRLVSKIVGFQPILTNVMPLASVLAPAT